LRWTTIGAHYNWSTKVYPDRRDPLPSELSTLAELVARALGYTDFRPQTAIVNYYASRSTLSGHVDRSERDHSRPLISFSFGQPAVYLSGGVSVDEVPIAMYLRSGDILVMADEQRLVYHAVPRIIVTGTFDGADRELFDSTVIDYAMHNRVNITVRQIE
jgi:alkylated DNA repair protein alkB family protein 1